MHPAFLAPIEGRDPPVRPIIDTVLRDEADVAALRRIIDVPVDYRPLGREPYRIEARGVALDGLRFWETTSVTGFRCAPMGGAHLLVLRMPTAGRITRSIGGRDLVCAPGAALLTPVDAARVTDFSADHASVSCTLGRAHLERVAADSLGLADPAALGLAAEATLSTPALQVLSATLTMLARRLPDLANRGADIGMPLIAEMFLQQLVAAWPRTGADPAGGEQPLPRQLRLALDFVDEQLARPITVGEVAAASGVTTRALQAAFRQRFGQSPLAHIIGRRLERVRADLLGSDGSSVSQIAYRWGFSHMGDFSRRYRARFGETPAQTLRRR